MWSDTLYKIDTYAKYAVEISSTVYKVIRFESDHVDDGLQERFFIPEVRFSGVNL